MIEGQEGVSWDQWLALALACEEAGLEALFRSDHYLSVSSSSGTTTWRAWPCWAGGCSRL
jgi:alkanesulfonate monooxygenase SsuD/methylene tetrahydromethanopterin reductase-like flavin-dependent oxidoreductase (luciferase family)